MSEHTAGPWQVDKEPEWAEESGGYWAVYIDESKLIAKVYHGEANARLIAAAPELLATLETLRVCLTAPLFDRDALDGMYDIVQAAIAKVRGVTS